MEVILTDRDSVSQAALIVASPGGIVKLLLSTSNRQGIVLIVLHVPEAKHSVHSPLFLGYGVHEAYASPPFSP
jgi:hypothetical protein